MKRRKTRSPVWCFGVGEFAGEAFDLGAFLGEIRIPLVGGAGIEQRVIAEVEAGLKRRAKGA